MKSFIDNIKKHYNFNNFHKKDLETRIGTIFLLSGFIMSLLAFVLTLAYSFGFWIVFPNLIMGIICLSIPVFSRDLKKSAYITLILVGLLYYPFIYSVAGGIAGPAPIYFIVIIAYISLYFEGKKALYLNIFMIFYFLLIVFLGSKFPELIISSGIDFLRVIDIAVSVASVSIVVSIISAATFNGYKQEHDKNVILMKQLEERNNELKILSNLDQLTNVYNRRHFCASMNREIDYCDRNHDSFNLLMIDIDGFKGVNDVYGHLFGDDVLRKIANEIKSCIRDYDFVSRYGGEEFAIILSHLNKKDSLSVAEEIREKVEKIHFDNDVKITVSIGITEFNQGDTYESVIKKADDNLYIAKSKGKNCVVS